MSVVLARTFLLFGMGMNLLVMVFITGLTSHEWFWPLFALVVFEFALFIIALFGYLQVTHHLIHPAKENVPYLARVMTDEIMSPNVDVRVMLQNLRAWKENYEYTLDLVELRLEDQFNMFGQVRRGENITDQPRAPRPPVDSTRGNGDSR